MTEYIQTLKNNVFHLEINSNNKDLIDKIKRLLEFEIEKEGEKYNERK